jgi:hypothetical protein
MTFSLIACVQKNKPTGYQIYTVEFNSTGGSYVTPATSNPETGKVAKPADPTKDGYIFFNWYEISLNEETGWHYQYIEDNGWNDWYNKIAFDENYPAFDFNKYWGNNRNVYAVWKPAPADAAILVAPTASNVQIGESTSKSRLTGTFNVDGDLHFVGEPKTLSSKGTVTCGWEFIPNDLEYNSIAGIVEVRFCEEKIHFETNGGLDPGDICFDDSYYMSENIFTAKNDYRFDGWTMTAGGNDWVQFPQIITDSIVLYAGYTAHTGNKVKYQLFEGKDMRASAKYNNSQVNGEVVIADMHEGRFVTGVGDFYETEITGITFNNYVKNIGIFKDCYYLESIYIPNSVIRISPEAFLRCRRLRSVVFEEGNENLEVESAAFAYCLGLTEISLARLTRIRDWMFSSCESLQSILIPQSVQEIYFQAFSSCEKLSEVIFIGDNLQKIGSLAFAGCRDLDSMILPPNTRISPDAFMLTPFSNLGITDEQINWIAQDLHNNFIGSAVEFKVNIERGIQYTGDNFEGRYIANTESVSLKFDTFSISILDALLHEFFHHYQYVLTIGVGDETYDMVPNYVDSYNYGRNSDVPIIIIQKNDWQERVENINVPYILISNTTIAEWLQPYIPLLPDESNWEEYWNQPFEADAREFASWFTGVNY